MTPVIHPGWMSTAWPGLDPDTQACILECNRVQPRLLALLALRLGWPDGPLEPTPDARLAARPAAEILHAATLAGAAWHARSIRQRIAASEVDRLTQAIGAPVRAFALAHAALAIAPAQPSATDLPAAIAEAARTCLAAWIDALPPGLRRLAMARLPPAPPAPPPPPGALPLMHAAARHLADQAAR